MQHDLCVYKLFGACNLALVFFSTRNWRKQTFFEDIYFNRNGMILIWARTTTTAGRSERVLNPLGNIHKNQNKTPLKWIYFYCSMIFSLSRCSVDFLGIFFGWNVYYVCNLHHPKFSVGFRLASNGCMNVQDSIHLMTKLRVLNMLDMPLFGYKFKWMWQRLNEYWITSKEVDEWEMKKKS